MNDNEKVDEKPTTTTSTTMKADVGWCNDQISKFQGQLKVLLYNHSILRKDLGIGSIKDSEAKLKRVECLLIKVSAKQRKVLDHLKRLQANADESSEKAPPAATDGKKETSASSSSKFTSTMSMKDRMAVVRGMRRTKKKPGPDAAGTASSSRKGSVSPSGQRTPPDDDDANYNNNSSSSVNGDLGNRDPAAGGVGTPGAAEIGEAGSSDLKPGQFDGYIRQCDKLPFDKGAVVAKYKEDYFEIGEDFTPREVSKEAASSSEFMLNLGLLTPVEVDDLADKRAKVRKFQNEYRDLTYVPEISDRKLRVSYSFLFSLGSNEVSPPLLRARKRRTTSCLIRGISLPTGSGAASGSGAAKR